jgi:hypothetical protein
MVSTLEAPVDPEDVQPEEITNVEIYGILRN